MRISWNKQIIILIVIGLGVAIFGIPALTQEKHDESTEGSHREGLVAQDKEKATNRADDIEKLYNLVRQARADLEILRVQAGIRHEVTEGRGAHGESGREGRGEHGEARREGRGEHGEGDNYRSKDPALRPLYNQLQLLRYEIKLFSKGLQERKR